MTFVRSMWFATFDADDKKVRALMGLASFAWAVELLVTPETFERPYYAVMRVLPAWVWSIAFALHGIGATYCIAHDKDEGRLASWVNGWGVGVWFSATIAQNLAQGRFLVSTSLEFLCCVFLFITWFKTRGRA